MALLLALVLLCSVAEGEEIKLGFLHIQSSSSWVVESYQQFKLGLQHINADSTLLPNDILKAVPYNGEGQSLVSMKGALHLIEQEQVVGIAGTGYSSAYAAPAMIASLKKVPMISGGSTLPDLMDKSGFPYGFRSIGNNGPMLRTMILFIQSQGWKNIAVLRGRESSASTFKQLKAELAHLDADISIVADATYGLSLRSDIVLPLESIKESGAKVILALLRTEDAPLVRKYAVEMGMDGDGYVWLANEAAYDSSFADWQGLLTFDASTYTNPESKAKRDKYTANWMNMTTTYNESTHGKFNSITGAPFFDSAHYNVIFDTDYAPVGDGKPDSWGVYYYDLAFIFARAIHQLRRQGLPLRPGDRLREALKTTWFNGITGEVSFDKITQDRAQFYDVLNIVNGSKRLIARTLWNETTDMDTLKHVALPVWPGHRVIRTPHDGTAIDPTECMITGSLFGYSREPYTFKVQLLNSFRQLPMYFSLPTVEVKHAGSVISPRLSCNATAASCTVRLTLPASGPTNIDVSVHHDGILGMQHLHGSPFRVEVAENLVLNVNSTLSCPIGHYCFAHGKLQDRVCDRSDALS
jgi:ABC-type branched-subunit amino acid transport system substrate-binding protein